MNNFTGYKIIETDLVPIKQELKRTWKERLFSLPWRPWKATKIEPVFYIINKPDKKWVITHPENAKNIKYDKE